MKTFHKTYLPDTIDHNGKKYVRDIKASATGKNVHPNAVKVLVMHPQLKGKTDLHGQPYQPSTWYFKPEEK